MATWLKTDGARVEVQPKDGRAFVLEELQSMVGGYIELVMIPGMNEVFVNKDGLAMGLPYNLAAIMLYDIRIVGNAVVVTKQESEAMRQE